MSFYLLLSYFFIYGILGWCTEVGYAGVKQGKFVNRGFLNGPICPIYGVGICIVVTLLTPLKDNLILLYITSTILVTILEGVTGYAMDKIFHNKWWDYSNQPLNIGGYVCLVFSLVWGVACVFVVDFIHPLIAMLVEHIPFIVLVIALVIFSIALFADLYVTSAAIFKLNKRLESMDKIAKELHEISDQLGEGIFNQVSTTMEKQAATKEKYDETMERIAEAGLEFKEKTQEVSEEMAGRVASLKESYQELAGKRSVISKRLVRAFPKMESRKHNDQLIKFKERLASLKK
ncbi:MAG: hypothetical protein PHQ72_04135 [Hespellia sp.]|nr:hypothetical protein [Hespellia sp.]